MECLTKEETHRWLNSFGLKIVKQDLFCAEPQDSLMITLPRDPVRLHSFAWVINLWLPQSANQLIWISNWETYPPDQYLLFEKVRIGCGEVRRLIDCPGHLFEPDKPESQPASGKAIANGIIFLMLAFNWEGYLVAEGCKDLVYIGDEFLSFWSAERGRLQAATDLVKPYNVKFITDVRQAWIKD